MVRSPLKLLVNRQRCRNMANTEIKSKAICSDKEKAFLKDFQKLFYQCPIPDNEILENVALFLNR